MSRPLRDARQYVFVDESGVTTDLLRRYARSLRGTRIGDHTPCGHWQTHTVVAALRPTELTATAVFDGPIDNATFRAAVAITASDGSCFLRQECCSRVTTSAIQPPSCDMACEGCFINDQQRRFPAPVDDVTRLSSSRTGSTK